MPPVTIRCEVRRTDKPAVVFGEDIRIGIERALRSRGKEKELVKAVRRMAELYVGLHNTWGDLEHEAIEAKFYADAMVALNGFDPSTAESNRLFALDYGTYRFRVIAS